MNNISRVTTSTMTADQVRGIYIKAGAVDDQRVLNIALAAQDEVGATPARKFICRMLNEQRAHLARRLGVELVGETDAAEQA